MHPRFHTARKAMTERDKTLSSDSGIWANEALVVASQCLPQMRSSEQLLRLRKHTSACLRDSCWLVGQGAEGQGTHLQQLNQEATCRCCLLLHMCAGKPHLARARLLLLCCMLSDGDCKCLQSLQRPFKIQTSACSARLLPSNTSRLWPGLINVVACLD